MPRSSGKTSALDVGFGAQGCCWSVPATSSSSGLQDTGVGGEAGGVAGAQSRRHGWGGDRAQPKPWDEKPTPSLRPFPPLAPSAAKVKSCWPLLPLGPASSRHWPHAAPSGARKEDLVENEAPPYPSTPHLPTDLLPRCGGCGGSRAHGLGRGGCFSVWLVVFVAWI